MSFLEELHRPDILDCIANLSSDEVFTPPRLANEILDILPKELFESPNTKFLDPCCKSGVFLREIVKRLDEGLKKKIPRRKNRIEHILKNQVFGLAITEITALFSRRSIYCSKDASNKDFSIPAFSDEDSLWQDAKVGNILGTSYIANDKKYHKIYHDWGTKTAGDCSCIICGASGKIYNRDDELENHAYSFIHTDNFKNSELFKRLKEMKFDVIIGNPPYQLSAGGGGKGSGTAVPIYHLFVEQAKKLNPRYITMIIPSRWYSGGRGLDNFRNNTLNDTRMEKIVDYIDSKECFPGVDIAGGICYFLWTRDKKNEFCEVENHFNSQIATEKRKLNEFEIFIRNNIAIDIVKKVLSKKDKFMNEIVSPVSLYGLNTNFEVKESGIIKVRYSGGIGYCDKSDFKSNINVNKYKTIISAASFDHGGQPDKNGQRKILSITETLEPGTICTSTYIVVSSFDTLLKSKNLEMYLKTRFTRFLMSQVCISQHISRDTFKFVPIQDFNEVWTDEKLYKKYGLTQEEIDFIESMIKPME